MKKIIESALLGVCAITSTQLNAAKVINKEAKPLCPNVILVITDDQGYGDMSCHGNPFIQTPQIDKLYHESVRLTNFHVDPTSAPSRSSLLTGKYSSKVGVWHTLQGRSIMNKDEVTMANVFEENGYKTGLFGKWHLGDNYHYRPQDRGYQEVLTFGGGGVGQNPDFWRNDYFDDIYLHNGKPEFYTGYCTDVWFDNAIKFIEKNKDKPFFCHLATNAPHFEYFVPNDYTLPFREKGMDDYISRYLGMIANIDENMGKLLKKLDDLSLKENTILIFMSDNGQSNAKLPREGQPFYYNAGMRGMKGSSYEGGHRVHCFIRWAGGKIQIGKDINQLTAQFDLMPTLIELCQLQNKHSIDFDGKSLAPLLKSNKSKWNERTLFVHNQRVETPVKWRNCAVMTEQYRLINGKELYDIINDPGQKTDVSMSHPDVVKKLTERYDEWWKNISGSFDKYSRIFLGDDHENPIKLNCHDWHSDKQLMVYSQELIRQRQHQNGFWAVNIVKDGEYEFTCRTYPIEEDTKLNVVKVRIKIGDLNVEKNCNPETSEVKIKLNLKAGDALMQTWFYEKDGNNYGVPFVYVKRL